MCCACQMVEYRVARKHFNNASPHKPYTEDCISAMPCFQLTRGAYPSSRRALLILTVNGFPIRRSICRVTGGSPFRLKRFQKKPITPASIHAMPKETDLSPALTPRVASRSLTILLSVRFSIGHEVGAVAPFHRQQKRVDQIVDVT